MKRFKWEMMLFGITIIFGFSYPFMSIVSYSLSPFIANFFKSSLGIVVMLPLALKTKCTNYKDLLISGVLLGIVMVICPLCQQIAADKIPSGKIGFITSLYVIITPILSFLIYKNKPSTFIVLSSILAVFGLYLLCGVSGLKIGKYDLVVLLAALSFAFEIILIDKYSKLVNPFQLTLCAIIVSSILNLIFACTYETFTFEQILDVFPELLYIGIGCTAIGYCGQIVGQKHVNKTISALIMSLESVVSVLGGRLFLHQTLTTKELIGCLIMFIAVVLCEITQTKYE